MALDQSGATNVLIDLVTGNTAATIWPFRRNTLDSDLTETKRAPAIRRGQMFLLDVLCLEITLLVVWLEISPGS